MSQFKKEHPRVNPDSLGRSSKLQNLATARVWSKKYDPPAAGRDQGKANVCGILGIVGLLALMTCLGLALRLAAPGVAFVGKTAALTAPLRAGQVPTTTYRFLLGAI